MCIRTYGEASILLDPRDGSTAAFSPGAIPDITAFDKAPDGLHTLVDFKCVDPITTESTLEGLRRSSYVPFAETGEYLTTLIRGRPAIDRPPGNDLKPGTFHRTNNVGKCDAHVAKYAAAIEQGHEIIAAITEVTGACHPETVAFMNRLSSLHANKLPLDLRGLSWTATTFSRYFRQHLSMAIHKLAVNELKRGIKNAVRAPKNWIRNRRPLAPPVATDALVHIPVVSVPGDV